MNNTTQTTDARKEAVKWWGSLNAGKAAKLRTKYFPGEFLISHADIEHIYLQEHPKENALPDYKIWWNGLTARKKERLLAKYNMPYKLGDSHILRMYENEHPAAPPVEVDENSTDQKVKLAIEQYNVKAKFDDRITENSYHAQFFRSGYIYGMVRANEEGCTWGLNQGKEERKKLAEQVKELTEINSGLDKQVVGLRQTTRQQANENTSLKETIASLTNEIECLKHNNKTACILAMEWGYKQCEKGHNIDLAFINYNSLINKTR